MTYKLLFLTERSERHQQAARAAAPPGLDPIVMLREPSRDEIEEEIGDADFLISERRGEIDGDLIGAASRLRLIQRLGSLVYDIDVEAARASGIPVCWWPLPSVVAVAEHLIWQILSLTRRSHESEAVAQTAGPWGESRRTDEDTFAVNWSRRTGLIRLQGRTVGIIGFGAIGVELARRLAGFGCRLLYNKRSRLPVAVESQLSVEYADTGALLAASDVLVNLLPYSPATDMLLDGTAFAALPRGGYVVSAGSGSVIDETALAEAIGSGHLGGAALDTFEWEPLRPDNPLLPLAKDPGSNVVLTPHTAAVSEESGRGNDYTNIRRLLAGEPLLYQID